MINGELRPTYLQSRGAGAWGRSSATTISDTCREWLRLARWLHERGITGIASCAGDEWRDYAAGRVNGVSRDHSVKILGQLTDLWAFDQLTACPSGSPGRRGKARAPTATSRPPGARRAGRT